LSLVRHAITISCLLSELELTIFICYANFVSFMKTFDAYVVGRDDAPGIVVIQEWWGVDYEIKNHAVKISQLGTGFKALIPE